MKLNLSILPEQVEAARKPELGVESKVYFAPENCILIGTIFATGATSYEYTPAGGLGVPNSGRDLFCRVSSATAIGTGGTIQVKLNVLLDNEETDTVTAAFQIPSYTPSQSNQFPIGITSDFVPDTSGYAGAKVVSIIGINSVANQTPGNAFEIYTSPSPETFVYIDVTRSKAGAYNLPGYVEIPDRYNAAAFVKLGRGESNKIKVEFETRGELEQLTRFNGSTGTLRFDVLKDDHILSARILYTDFIVRANGERGDGNDIVKYTAEGPYQRWFTGYARVLD